MDKTSIAVFNTYCPSSSIRWHEGGHGCGSGKRVFARSKRAKGSG